MDPDVRAGMSTFAAISQRQEEAGLRRLAEDLQTGAWLRRFGHLLDLDELDLGYRLIVAGPQRSLG